MPVATVAPPIPLDPDSPRERLLAAADELFYEEGIHTVGIDRIIERAGVAKATLYSAFGSKEELIRAYLLRRHESRVVRVLAAVNAYDDPRDRILGVFDALATAFAVPGYHGCAFQNATAESRPGSAATEVAGHVRQWTRTLFTDLARDTGAADPGALAQQLQMVCDGAMVSGRLDADPAAAFAARAVAATLVDAATPDPDAFAPTPTD